MSWQAYIDQSLIGTGKIDHAAIFSSTGDSCWARSPGFDANRDEIQAVITGLTKKGQPLLYDKGLTIGEVKYLCIKADDRSIYGRKGKEGICCVKTVQAILVAHYPDGVQASEAANAVETLADYLIKLGY